MQISGLGMAEARPSVAVLTVVLRLVVGTARCQLLKLAVEQEPLIVVVAFAVEADQSTTGSIGARTP